MNSRNIAPRIFSFVMAALITATMLGTIDTLARNDLAADSLMAQAVAARPA
jgi:hypothetical protein